MKRKPSPSTADQLRPFGVEYVPPSRRKKLLAGGVFVGRAAEIPPGRSKQVHLENATVAVFNVDGRFYAVKDACPHADYPLYKGTLEGEVVQCANHNWKFNVRTGECVRGDPTVKVRCFEVEIRGEEIWVKT